MRFLSVITLLLLAFPAHAAGPLAEREILPNRAVLLVAERQAIPIEVLRVSMPAIATTLPAPLANTSVFIFIASMVAILSPTATDWPTVTLIDSTVPASGATSSPAPASGFARA